MHPWTHRTARPAKSVALLWGAMLALSACAYVPFGFTPIRDILAHPTQYENKQVKVLGVVSDVTKLPFLNTAFYTLTENKAQIIVTTQATTPASGSHVIVVGEVESVAIIGDQSIGLHIREIKRVEGQFVRSLY